MKTDLDRLMAEQGLDALIMFPTERENPYRTYLANGADFSGMVIKKRGETPVLFPVAMERDEAAKSGLPILTREELGFGELAREYKNDLDGMIVAWYRRVFERVGVQGKIGVYGVGDVGVAFRTITRLQEGLKGLIEFVADKERASIFDQAYETKDPGELARLREVGRRASAVMRAARDWIAGHRAQDGVVIQADGAPLTIGDVKRYVRMQLFEHDLEDPEGMIFAQGRDAAVPHSKGEDRDPLRLGQSIIFDLFPRESRGYFHDMTRTWCIGYAPPEVQAAYDHVMEAFHVSTDMCRSGLATNLVQQRVCELFEGHGHPSVLHTPDTTAGYTHSLAHGVGLNVHEAPYFPTYGEHFHLQPGNVFTIEPGLYYPDRGFGVRVEDTVYLNERGELENLTDCPYDLVIELEGQRANR